VIDPGRPFSEAYRYIIEALEERIRRGVERARFTFEGVDGTYALPETVQTVTLISGEKDGEPHTFFLDDDFQIIGGQIVWLSQGTTPDPDSQFEVRYVYQESPAGLTDFNPGSVVGTLVRAVAREMKLLYDQMDEAYRRAFIDQATGVALDNVVAMLGTLRNPAQRAKGEVTFSRRQADGTVTVEAGVRVADESGRTFVTTEEGKIEASELSATVPVEATQPGPEGNVNAGAVVIMPTPPEGVDGVVNEEPITGGQLPEPDDQLRERAKHELERRGNATLNAIKFAVLDIDGVEGVEVIDHSTDSSVPLGEIRVMYSGGDLERVEQVTENTRAAGIFAPRPVEIEPILISGTFYLIPEPDALPAAAGQFASAAAEAIRSLTVGEPLSVRRLNALAYDVPGLADVAEAQLTHDRETPPEPVSDPFVVDRSELVRPNETGPDRLKAVLVSTLEADSRREDPDDTANEVDLRLVDSDEHPIEWNNFSLDVSATLLARLRTAPEQAPERVGSLGPLTVTWSGTDTTALTITADDAPGLERDDYIRSSVEVVVHAAAYPGILDAETTVNLSLPLEE